MTPWLTWTINKNGLLQVLTVLSTVCDEKQSLNDLRNISGSLNIDNLQGPEIYLCPLVSLN